MKTKMILILKLCSAIILLSFLAQGSQIIKGGFIGESNDIRLSNILYTDVYSINENNSAIIDEYVLITYVKPEDINIIGIEHLLNFTFTIMSTSNEKTYNYSIADIDDFDEHSLTSFSSDNMSTLPNFYYREKIGQFENNFYHHIIEYSFKSTRNDFDESASDLYRFQFMINNVSYKYNDIYTLVIPQTTIYSVQNTSRQIKVNLPNSPYYYAEYISSNVNPTEIITTETSQSISWDSPPQINIILFYRIVDNSVNKKTTELQMETNKLEEQAYESSKLSIILGILSFILVLRDLNRTRKKK